MNTDLRKEAKNNFEKDFFKLANNAFFRKTMENVKKHGDIKLVTTEKNESFRMNNYHTTKCLTEHLLAIKMIKTEILMNKPVYLGFSLLELSKVLI